MTIDTPAGTINQITPIREFVELTTITNAQYLLGIQNMSTGNGSKITFGNLITSLISGDADNKLIKGNDDKLFISTPIEIGTLDDLTTSDKTDIVSAINELNSNMGSLSNLETTVKTSLVAAINSVAELTEPELLLDKVNQSKALVTGNVASYQEELEQIKLMKRSTFDRSKFTVVGSPNITKDGIASGFSSSNYLQATIPALTNATNFEIKAKFIIGAIPSSGYSVILADNSGANYGLSIWTYNSTKLTVRCNSASSHLAITDISQNDNIDILLKTVSSTSAYCLCYKNGTKVYDDNIDISTMQPWTNKIDIGNRNSDPNNSYFTGSIDLKQFSITVDGVEVLSGNKTGIDTIKADNYSAISSGTLPTISADGIASNFTPTSFIDGGMLGKTPTQSWKRTVKFKTPSSWINGIVDVVGSGIQYTDAFYIEISSQNRLGLTCTHTGDTTTRLYMTNPQLNTWYNAEYGQYINGTTVYSYFKYKTEDEADYTSVTPTTNITAMPTSSYVLRTGNYLYNNNVAFAGEIDLNTSRTYIDGNLTYQSCLKIPYYESSVQYGSKIVDVQYRDRVLDAYQQGYKDYKYYTLDEINGNFTLPHGELYGMLEQIRTENEQNNEAVRQIIDIKDNLYKILEGHQSTNKTLWDLITFTDNSEADNLLIGGDSPFTSNSSSSDFHFYLLNSTSTNNYNPDDTAKANVYKLFNKSHFDSQSDPIYVKDGTIVITCANPTKLSKILLRSYDTNSALPTIITVCGANITNNMSREIVSSDFSSAKYIGGISQTKEAAYNDPTSTNWGLNRPLELTIDDKDTFNTFFINLTYWYAPSGTDGRLVGVQLYGTQMANDDSDYTVKMSGEYENCKWIASNGNIYNTDDLYQQYGYIPKEKASLARWVSCFGSGIGQANATTRAAEQYYPKYISGSISSTTLTSGQPWWVLRQTNYSAENRPKTGYNTPSVGYIQKNTTLNNQTVIDYTADSYFPVGEYYWEGIFGYNDASRGNCYLANWCQLQKVYDDDSVEIIQTFSKEGSMYESSVCYRTPRFYASRAFKKLRLIIQEENYPNNAFILSQMQLYYRDTNGTIARSFIPSATQYDLSYNTVKHKSNIHFFITPTGVRVGSNCFVQKTDPTTRAACVGNRWINENTKKSYVCNTSGVWTEEDFCEIGCMTMFGSKHVGMRSRTVANSENPMQKYIQDYEDIGGNLALNYNMVSNATTVITTSPTDPDYYFQAEAADENAGVNFYMPANTVNIQAYRRALVKSKIYQSGQQFAHYSNSSRMGAILMAYKTFDTSAAGEYIEGSEEEEQ